MSGKRPTPTLPKGADRGACYELPPKWLGWQAGRKRLMNGSIGSGPGQVARSLVCFAMHQDTELAPFLERVNANLGIEADDFAYPPSARAGGIGKVCQLFGAELPKVLESLNRELAV